MNVLDGIKTVMHNGLARNYNPGSTILYQGEVPRSAYIVKSGYAKSFNISSDGSEQIVNFHVPGELLPIGWVFGKATASLYFVEAMTHCSLVLVQREAIQKEIHSQPKLMEAMLDQSVSNYTATMLHICALEQAKAQQKILYTLYYLSKKFGSLHSDKADILIELTHQDIASLVGLTRETTATELNKLKKQGILSYKNKKYQVDVKELIEAMGEESFLAIKL
jgi:CRP-like cAMP-binding protein